MASTPLLGLSLPADGTTNWGTLVNTSITALLDSAVAGTTTLTVDGDAILSDTQEATNEARQAIILWKPLSGTATRTITAPAKSKTYVVINATGGTQSIIFRGSGSPPTTGVTIPAGKAYMLAWNGLDFITTGVTTVNLATDVTGILGVVNGGTGQSTYTNGQLLIGNTAGNTLTKATLTGGTGITITNGAGSITVGGASATVSDIGMVKLGDAAVQTVAANAVTSTASRTYALQLNGSGQGVVNIPWTDTVISPAGANTQIQYNNAGSFGGSANFVFDGTNVGVGESSPSTYGKFVVGGTTSFTSALVSTSATATDKPTFTFRKTANTGASINNQIGRVSFFSQQGTAATESAYISVVDNRAAGVSSPQIKIATYVGSTTLETGVFSLGASTSLYSSANIVYDAPSHQLVGDVAISGSASVSEKFTTAVGSVASGATITPDADFANQYNVTALAVPATIAAPSGTPVDGQKLLIRLKDNGTARALTWNAIYRTIGTTLPATTVATKTTYVGCIYNAADTKWDVVAVTTEA